MRIHEIMTKEFHHINQDDSIRHAAEIMRSLDLGLLPIIEENQVVGAVTDRDIVIRGVADGLEAEAPVSSVMSKGVRFKYADEDVTEAAS